MDTQNPNVPSHAHTRVAGKKHPNRRHPHSGLVHDNARHTTRFTVIGNHLAQHPELSLLAIGLSVHIQSLPAGARIDIKSLAARFPEGTTRIAAALRELETHGYLRRTRERVPDGRIITRTTSCNQPGHSGTDAPRPAPRKRTRQPGGKPLPAVPRPAYPAPSLLQQATDLLTGLRREDTRLLLSGCDTAHLAPGVAAWLERDVSPAAVRHALTADLPPEPLHRPAALLAHRLTAQLPPPPPFAPPQAAPPPARHPLQTCDGCDRAFRAPQPGHCRDCRSAAALSVQSPSRTGLTGTPEVIKAVSGVVRSRGENKSGPS
ncbi:helix-turn-helix domain-containing protein [Streptomyces luteogriseus]|uniref:helix-turn-helix domain-containing protein n=1 Tax=Streptomyces luteogriseus TaxID=68233 RepID=UPI0033C0F947